MMTQLAAASQLLNWCTNAKKASAVQNGYVSHTINHVHLYALMGANFSSDESDYICKDSLTLSVFSVEYRDIDLENKLVFLCITRTYITVINYE